MQSDRHNLNQLYEGIIYLKWSSALKIQQQFSCKTFVPSIETPQIPEGLKLAVHKRQNIKSHITVKFNVTTFACDSIQKQTKVCGSLSQRKHNKVRRMRRPSYPQ